MLGKALFLILLGHGVQLDDKLPVLNVYLLFMGAGPAILGCYFSVFDSDADKQVNFVLLKGSSSECTKACSRLEIVLPTR